MRVIYFRQTKRKENSEITQKFEEILKTYSPEELFSKGKELAEESHYAQASIIFKKLMSCKDMSEIARTYLCIVNIGVYNRYKQETEFSLKEIGEYFGQLDEVINLSIIEGMKRSISLHTQGVISKNEMLGIEKLIDRVIIENTNPLGRKGFEKEYCRFKDYNLGVFLQK